MVDVRISYISLIHLKGEFLANRLLCTKKLLHIYTKIVDQFYNSLSLLFVVISICLQVKWLMSCNLHQAVHEVS